MNAFELFYQRFMIINANAIQETLKNWLSSFFIKVSNESCISYLHFLLITLGEQLFKQDPHMVGLWIKPEALTI